MSSPSGSASPGEQRRNNEADAFARSGRGEAEHMLGAVVAQIFVTPPAEHHAVMAKEAGKPHFPGLRPPSRAVSGDLLHLPGTPHGHRDRDGGGCDPTGRRDVGAFDEDRSRVCVVGEPPPKNGRWVVDRPAEDVEPRVSQSGLECQTPGDPLRLPPRERRAQRRRRRGPGPRGSWSRSWRRKIRRRSCPSRKPESRPGGRPDTKANESEGSYAVYRPNHVMEQPIGQSQERTFRVVWQTWHRAHVGRSAASARSARADFGGRVVHAASKRFFSAGTAAH